MFYFEFGKIEAQRDMTINLLKEDILIEKIVAVTGLSEEDIKNVEINK